MRTVTIIMLVVLIGVSAMAENGPFSKGSKSASGGITFTHLSGDAYYSTTLISINPELTTCMGNGLFVGGTVILDYQKIEFEDYFGSSTADKTSWLLGGTLEKYFVSNPDDYSHSGFFYPFLRVLFAVGKDEDITLSKLGGSLGGIYMVGNNSGIEISVLATYDSFSYNSNSISGVTLKVGTGFSYFIF